MAVVSFDDTGIAFSYKSDSELKKAVWLFSLMNSNTLVTMGTTLTPLAIKWRLPVNALIRATIFKQFCGGETLEETSAVINRLSQFNVETILDYGTEAKENDDEFEKTTLQTIAGIQFAKQNSHVPFVSLKITGIAPVYLLDMLHSWTNIPDSERNNWELVKGRMHRICKAAHDAEVGVMIDAEETWIQNPVDDLAMEMMHYYNREKPIVYNTLQLYRTDRVQFLKSSFEKTKADGALYAVKLVRGAYMEKERKRAAKKKYPSPIQPDKEACDKDYNAAVEFCLEHIDRISFCVASHNEFSNQLAVNIAQTKGLPPSHPHLHFSQLYGMSDNITFNLAHAGYNVSKYLPYGPVKDVVPYLMRRAQENTSVGGMTGRELMLLKKELKRRRS